MHGCMTSAVDSLPETFRFSESITNSLISMYAAFASICVIVSSHALTSPCYRAHHRLEGREGYLTPTQKRFFFHALL